jgi:hypothetical protein
MEYPIARYIFCNRKKSNDPEIDNQYRWILHTDYVEGYPKDIIVDEKDMIKICSQNEGVVTLDIAGDRYDITLIPWNRNGYENRDLIEEMENKTLLVKKIGNRRNVIEYTSVQYILSKKTTEGESRWIRNVGAEGYPPEITIPSKILDGLDFASPTPPVTGFAIVTESGVYRVKILYSKDFCVEKYERELMLTKI